MRLRFFDIRTANEDRSNNNYKVLLVRENGHYHLFPIDHEACFNHEELNNPLIPITKEESMISSEAFAYIFGPKDFSENVLADIKEKYYLRMKVCDDQLAAILASIPVEWEINTTYEENILGRFLFNDIWFTESWASYISYIHFFTNKHENN